MGNSDWTISAFGVATDGSLSSIGTYSAGSPAISPKAVAINPVYPYLYATNDGDSSPTITAFKINNGGSLSFVSAYSSSSQMYLPLKMAFSPDRNYLFVVDQQTSGSNSTGAVTVFSVNPSTGALTYKSLVSTGNSFGYDIAMHPNGNYLYTSNPYSYAITEFSVSSGTLTKQKTFASFPYCSTSSDTHGPYGLAVSPDGNYLYAESTYGVVFSFDISGGTFTNYKSASGAGVAFSTDLTLSPNGKFIYVGEVARVNYAYACSSGSFSTIGNYSAGIAMAVSSDSKYLYGANDAGKCVSAFAISSTDGSLSALATSSYSLGTTTPSRSSSTRPDPGGGRGPRGRATVPEPGDALLILRRIIVNMLNCKYA